MIQPNAVEWVYIFVAIITAVLGYFAIIISTRIAEASTVAPYRYSRLIFSTLLAMAFLISPMALPGLRCFGHVLEQFMMVWQR